MAKQKKASVLGEMLALVGVMVIAALALAATNPDEDQFRRVMRLQDKLMLDIASLLPIERTNYVLFSKFEVKYLIGKTTCYGMAAYVFVCPEKAPQTDKGGDKQS
jgi:hypothetical protein